MPASVEAQSDDERASLRGAPFVFITVELTEDASSLRDVGVSGDALQNRISARLRTARIPVVEDVPDGGGAAVLHTRLRALRFDDGKYYVWSLDVKVAQHVALMRNPELDIIGVTWGNHAFGFSPTIDLQLSITGMLDQFLDRFINDFLAENEP